MRVALIVLLAVVSMCALANAAAKPAQKKAVPKAANTKPTVAPKVAKPVVRPPNMKNPIKGAAANPFGKLTPPLAACKNSAQCASGVCDKTCGLMSTGQACKAHANCLSSQCDTKSFKCQCTGPVASNKYGQCRKDTDCCAPTDPTKSASLYCETSTKTCKPGIDPTLKPLGAACKVAKECASNACEVDLKGLFSCAPGGAGAGCQNDTQCLSGKCANAKCNAVGLGKACRATTDCAAPVISSAVKNLKGAAAKSAKAAAAKANVASKVTCHATAKTCQANGCSKKNFGDICTTNADCCSNNCTTVAAGIMKCAASAPGGNCDTSLDCVNGGCNAQGKCPLALKGQICYNSKQCAKPDTKTNAKCVIPTGKTFGACDYLGCGPLATVGATCAKDADCCSGICDKTSKKCQPTGSGRACNANRDCVVSYNPAGKALTPAAIVNRCVKSTRLCACATAGQSCLSDAGCCNKSHKCKAAANSSSFTSIAGIKYTIGVCRV